jgi:hypothetical protein
MSTPVSQQAQTRHGIGYARNRRRVVGEMAGNPDLDATGRFGFAIAECVFRRIRTPSPEFSITLAVEGRGVPTTGSSSTPEITSLSMVLVSLARTFAERVTSRCGVVTVVPAAPTGPDVVRG